MRKYLKIEEKKVVNGRFSLGDGKSAIEYMVEHWRGGCSTDVKANSNPGETVLRHAIRGIRDAEAKKMFSLMAINSEAT